MRAERHLHTKTQVSRRSGQAPVNSLFALLTSRWTGPGFVVPFLVLLIPTRLPGQDAKPECPRLEGFTRCSPGNDDERVEQISQALHDFAEEPVRQSGADLRPQLGLIEAKIASSGNRMHRERDEGARDDGARDDGAGDGGIYRAERRLHRMKASSTQAAPGYDEALDWLRGSGMAWAEACALATAHARRIDWLTASRRCVAERTGADSYRAFLGTLEAGGVSARNACVAAEHYWNGLSEGRARVVCGSRDEREP